MSAERVDSGSTLPVGTMVKLENLQNATDLNGKAGKVIRVLPDGRYQVELLHDAQRRLSLKRANLRVMNNNSGRVEQQERTCLECSKFLSSEKLLCCSKCRMAHYCSKACQTSHWKKVHKDDCKLLRSARKAKDDEDKLPADRGDRIFARQQRGFRYQEQGNVTGAEKEYRAIIEIEGAHWAANYLNLAGMLVQQSKTKEAVKMLRKAVKCDSTGLPEKERIPKCRAYGLLGDILLKERRNIPEAKDALQKCVELDSSNAHAWKSLAVLLISQGDNAGAENAMQRSNQAAASGPAVDGSTMEISQGMIQIL